MSFSKKNHSHFQRGFSLVEIMVVVAIVGIIGAGISSMMFNANKQSRAVSAQLDFDSLVNTLQSMFNNTGSCLAAFGGGAMAMPGAFPAPMTMNIGGTAITPGGKYGSLLSIMNFELAGKSAGGAAHQWIIPLNLVASRAMGSDQAKGVNLLSHKFNLIVITDATDTNITGCSAQYTNFWVSSTSSSVNITYFGGTVGVGLPDPDPTVDLDVSNPGSVGGGTIQAQKYIYASDVRLKENIREIPSALDRVLSLRGVIFDWKNTNEPVRGKNQLGVIAQEVEQVFPEAVSTSPKTGLKAVAYGNLVAPLIEAIKAQQEIILQQQKEISDIKNTLKKNNLQ